MATSDFWQRVSATVSTSGEWAGEESADPSRNTQDTVKLWIFLDLITILGSAIFSIAYELHTGPVDAARRLYHGAIFQGRPMGILVAILAGFSAILIIISRRLHLYTPARLSSFLHEQHLSVRACFTAGLFLTGTLYLIHADEVPRTIVLLTLGMVTIALSLRRIVYRVLMYRRFDRGIDTRNVLIVGTGPEAHALRHHLESIRHLGYTFKGFIDFSGSGSRLASSSGDVVGTLDTLFQHARKQFVDEIFFASHCERGIVKDVLEKARTHGVDLRVVPDLYDGLAWNTPIEYIGQFPTIPLYRGHVAEFGLVLKRTLDILFSSLVLLILAPFLLFIAIAVKLDSKGPVFYASERIGKKGRVFRCIKFRTMVRDAEKKRADIMHMNERDGILFKISNDPRITRVGRFLRKYSLDELPQFFNVLHGDMSVVGPRPPIASEVKEYNLSHLRRLDVTPGITGLWQVQGRRDPSFDSYVSLDVAYIEGWSIWLDLKIIVRTVGVVLSGTGS